VAGLPGTRVREKRRRSDDPGHAKRARLVRGRAFPRNNSGNNDTEQLSIYVQEKDRAAPSSRLAMPGHVSGQASWLDHAVPCHAILCYA